MIIRSALQTRHDFIFLGDSLVADYDWQPRLPFCTIHNLGVPGASTDDLLSSLPGLADRFPAPSAILIMIGTNDLLSGKIGFVETIRQIVIQLSQSFPTAEIIVTSLLPMQLSSPNTEAVQWINEDIRTMTMQTGSCYLDIHSKLSRAGDGLFQDDGVHLTDRAYDIWTKSLIEHVAFLLENDED
jgi:lysophospholipase L1-like esterase